MKNLETFGYNASSSVPIMIANIKIPMLVYILKQDLSVTAKVLLFKCN